MITLKQWGIFLSIIFLAISLNAMESNFHRQRLQSAYISESKLNKIASWDRSIDFPREAINTKCVQQSVQSAQKEQKKDSFYGSHVNFVKQVANNLQSNVYRDNLIEKKALVEKEYSKIGNSELIKQSKFIDVLLDGSIYRMLTNIQKVDLNTAIKTFAELEKSWPWVSQSSITREENRFIKFLGVDIMQVAQSSLICRKDYLDAHGILSNVEEFQCCIRSMQLEGNTQDLKSQRRQILSNYKKNNLQHTPETKVKLAIINSLLSDPLTEIFYTIKNAKFDTATQELDHLKMQLLWHFETNNLKDMNEAKADMINRHGIDLLEAANKCFESRSDYQPTSSQRNLNNSIVLPGFNKDSAPYEFPGLDREKMPCWSPGAVNDNIPCLDPVFNENDVSYQFPGSNENKITHELPGVGYPGVYAYEVDFYGGNHGYISGTNGSGNDSYGGDYGDSAPHYNTNDSSHRKECPKETTVSEFKKMQMRGDKKGLEAKKQQLERDRKRAHFWQKNEISRNIAEIDKILDSWVTDSLSVIKEGGLDAANEELAFLERRAKGEDSTSLLEIYNVALDIYLSRSDVKSRMHHFVSEQKTILSQKIESTWSPCERIELQEQINVLNELSEYKGQIATSIDSFDVVSTTITNSNALITSETNQRLVEMLSSLNDQSLEAISNHIDVLTDILQDQDFDAETRDKCFALAMESQVLLQKYIEAPGKHIVGQPTLNAYIFNARKEALNSFAYNPTKYIEKSYAITPEACAMLELYDINPDQFTYCFGNEVQHQFHTEFATIIQEIADTPLNILTNPLLDMTLTYAYVGSVCMQHNDIEKAFSLADCAWATLDCAKAICKSGQKATLDITEGIVGGCINAIHNTAEIVMHPRNTLSTIAASFTHLGECLVNLSRTYYTEDNFFPYATPTPEQLQEKLKESEVTHQEMLENIQSVIDAAKEITLKDATSFVTEQVVSGKLFVLGIKCITYFAKLPLAQMEKIGKAIKAKVPDKAAKVVSAARKKVIDKIGQITQKNHVAVTGDGLKLKVFATPEEVSLLQHSVSDTGKIASEISSEINILVKNIEERSFVDIKHPVLNNIRTGSALKSDPFHSFNSIIDNFACYAKKFNLTGGDGIVRDLYQIEGSLNGQNGVFEWIVDSRPDKGVTHRLFIKNGIITGKPNVY